MKTPSINKSVSIFGAAVLMFLLVETLKAIEMPPNIQTYLQTATVTEVGFPSGTEQQRTAFTTWLTANWAAVLADIETVAPDERRQKVIGSGAEFLPSTDYVSFLSGWLDKYQAGKVTKPAAINAVLADGKKSGFLAFNYQHQTVINLCNRVKSIFTNESAVQQSMNEVLSGAQRRQAALAAFNEGRPEPEILPAP
jgi:hypothetical protein